jgi:hypothetical protein
MTEELPRYLHRLDMTVQLVGAYRIPSFDLFEFSGGCNNEEEYFE